MDFMAILDYIIANIDKISVSVLSIGIAIYTLYALRGTIKEKGDASNKHLEIISKSIKELNGHFMAHSKEDDENMKDIQREISKIKMSIGKTILSNTQAVEIAKSRVGFQSFEKLAFIKGRLEKNNIKERKNQIKKSIKSELTRQSLLYAEDLNQYTTQVGLIGDYISNNFDMDNFLLEVYDIVFRLSDKDNIQSKMDDIQFIMMDYQNRLWTQMGEDLKKSN